MFYIFLYQNYLCALNYLVIIHYKKMGVHTFIMMVHVLGYKRAHKLAAILGW